jgi:phosphoglycolate phosphatase
MTKHFVFDFDGTIANSLEVVVKTFNVLAEKYGFQTVKPEHYSTLQKLPIHKKLKVLNIPYYKVLSMKKVGAEFKKKYSEFLDEIDVIEGMREVCAELQKMGCRLSILSSNSKENINHFLKHHQLEGFDHIYSSEGLFGKQHTLNKFTKQTGIAKADIIYVGDELRDIEACKKSNVRMVAVTWGLDSLELLKSAEPDFVALKPNDLLKLV